MYGSGKSCEGNSGECDMEVKTIEHLENPCAGCVLCSVICPTEAINLVVDEEGFLQPNIDTAKCIQCGLCYEKCILDTSVSKRKQVRNVYAAFSLDTETRYQSTSGGIFTELAKVVLEKLRGVVIGAAYQKNFLVKHELIQRVEEIPRIRQSKYIQSDVREVYKEIDKLSEDILIMFVGTPCQISAFHQYMKERKNPTLYVDFICRGVNSPGVFQTYLEELESTYESKISNVWFKNKEEGWNHFQTRVDFENGSVYIKDRYKDFFMRGFLKHNLYMRKSCHECQFKGEERIADITLADFWGVEFEDKEVDIENGVSAVLIRSDMGKAVFSMLEKNVYFEEKTLEDVRKGNGCIDDSVKCGEYRAEFFSRLKNEKFSKIIWSLEE